MRSLSVTLLGPRVETLKRYWDSVHPERQLCVSLLEVGRGWGGAWPGRRPTPLTKEARHVRCTRQREGTSARQMDHQARSGPPVAGDASRRQSAGDTRDAS